jgi:hypothetical protein
MKFSVKLVLAAFVLLFPALAAAQSLGQVACARQDTYTYLYSSMTTLDVMRTLPCGEQVDIIGRYDGYFGVRTSKGEIGYIAQGSIFLLKDKPGPKAPQPAAAVPPRPRTAYDAPVAPPPAPANPLPPGFDLTLPNGTPIHLKLNKSLSSETAHVGDVVDLTVTEDVLVDGLCVIPRGASAVGIVTEAEPKKRMGHGGKLGLGINFVRLANNDKAAVRSFQEGAGSNSPAGSINPLAHGKEVVFSQGAEMTAYVDGDIYLKRAAFQPSKDAATPAPAAQNPSQPHKF